MNTLRTILTAASAALVLQAAQAQGHGELDFVRNTNARIASSNASFLSTLPIDRVSLVEADANIVKGGLCMPWESDDSWAAGAHTESFVKISEKIAFYGRLSYSNFTGKNMGGSILLNPSYNPVDFHEFDEDNTGKRNREIYDLSGGMSLRLGPRWTLGIKADYQAANQAKRKDPRFSTSWMDLGLGLGARVQCSESFALGFDGRYRNTMEGMKAGIYGTSGKLYYALVDFGGFYGYKELLDGDYNFISTQNTRYMANNWYGGAVQFDAGGRNRFFTELEFLMRSGYFGNRSTTSVVFTEHKGMKVSLKADYKIAQNDNLHVLSLNGSFATLSNDQNKYNRKYVTGIGNQIEYLGSTEVLSRSDIDALLSYTAFLGIKDNEHLAECGASLAMEHLGRTATLYPFYREQDYTRLSAELFGKMNFLFGKNKISLSAALDFLYGMGTKANDGTLVSSTSSKPQSKDFYLNRWFECLTAPQAGASLALRYTRMFNKLDVYVDLSDRYISALGNVGFLTGKYRNSATITLGCSF